MWILRNRKSINLWYDKWMENSHLVHNINPNMIHCIEENDKVSDLITPTNLGH